MHEIYNKRGNLLPTNNENTSRSYTDMMETEFNIKLNGNNKKIGVYKEIKLVNNYIIEKADFVDPKTITGEETIWRNQNS